jgi:Kef-type K+ transport system membrane component KefB
MPANSSVEVLLWMLIAASVIAVIANRIGIPYPVALVLGGLLLSVVHGSSEGRHSGRFIPILLTSAVGGGVGLVWGLDSSY